MADCVVLEPMMRLAIEAPVGRSGFVRWGTAQAGAAASTVQYALPKPDDVDPE